MHHGDYNIPLPPGPPPQPSSQHPPYYRPYNPPPPPPPQPYNTIPSNQPPLTPSIPSSPSFASAPPYSATDYSSISSSYPSSFPNFNDPTPPPPPPPQYQSTPYYPTYDPNQTTPNYPHLDHRQFPSNFPVSNPNSSSTSYVSSYDGVGSKYEHVSGYFDENLSGYGSFGSSRSNLGSGYEYNDGNYGSNNKHKLEGGYEYKDGNYGSNNRSNLGGGGGYEYRDANYGLNNKPSLGGGGGGGYEYKDDGVYAYEGKNEPYGARGTTPTTKSSNWSGLFDDYGRSISFPKEEKEKKSSSSEGGGGYSGSGSLKVVRAVPKVEDKSDGQSGVQKFRVKLLPESGGQGLMDVLCMVGLDGIRMLDPNTSRTLRIYPLDSVTRCDKIDSSTFAFWSKTTVDVEPRRIRLQSNSYTTNTLLDTVTAATVQFKEMGGRIRSSEAPKALDTSSEKKKGLGDWIYKLKPVNEEKDHWVPDEAVSKCTGCGSDFGAFNRRHHCRNCGDVFCDKCTQGRTPLTSEENAQPVRVCDRCMAEVTHRLSKAKEAANRPVTQSHEDLAKKLQEEMEKNLKISSGSKSESTGKRMREVACPTCTVHLQVQVPSSGSETIECGVCQHPFIVSAN